MFNDLKRTTKKIVILGFLSYSLSTQPFWNELFTSAKRYVAVKMINHSLHCSRPMFNWAAYLSCCISHRLGHNFNARNKKGMSLLHQAAFNGSTGAVNALIGYGLDINAKANTMKVTPLHLAVLKNQTSIIKTLIKASADLHMFDSIHATPLHIAAMNSNNQAIRLLLDAGANPNVKEFSNSCELSPLHHAVVNNNSEGVRLLVSKGANSQCVAVLNKETSPTLLKKFSINLEVCEGEDCVNHTLTPIDVAQRANNTEMLKVLTI